MINLLPKEQKKKIVAEYKMRLVTVGAILLLSVIIISTIVITPFYFTTKATLARSESIFNNSKNSPDLEIDSESMKVINNTENDLKLLFGYDKQKLVSKDVIDIIVANKGNTISINSINYANSVDTKDEKANSQMVVSVGGIAQNREELKSFVYRLMGVQSFTNVSVPISNYLKGVDLEFVITLNIK